MNSQLSSCAGSRDYLERLIPVHSVCRESAAIQREDPVGLHFFAQNNQSGVGEIHRDVAIFFHQRRNPLQAGWGRRHQLKRPSKDKLKTSFLSPPLRPDQVKGLGEHRFGGDNGTVSTFQRRHTVRVGLLVSVHERHEGSGIQQKLIGHGVTDESGNRGGAGPDRAGRWQRCRADRARARWDTRPVGCRENAPRLGAPLPNACVSSALQSALAWRPSRRAVAWSIAVPYQGLPLHCSVMPRVTKVQLPLKNDDANGLTSPPHVLVRADRVIR